MTQEKSIFRHVQFKNMAPISNLLSLKKECCKRKKKKLLHKHKMFSIDKEPFKQFLYSSTELSQNQRHDLEWAYSCSLSYLQFKSGLFPDFAELCLNLICPLPTIPRY